MKSFLILSLLFATLPLFAKVLISPSEAMRLHYPKSSQILKKNILLNAKNFQKIQKESQVKLRSKIFKSFLIKEGDKSVAYGVLINRKVRSKNAVILYIISNESKLVATEIVAFNEPSEYIPSKSWLEQFDKLSTQKSPHLGEEIATVTGATLSARSITDGARVAFALYNTILREK